jgi:hypothetical protein
MFELVELKCLPISDFVGNKIDPIDEFGNAIETNADFGESTKESRLAIGSNRHFRHQRTIHQSKPSERRPVL